MNSYKIKTTIDRKDREKKRPIISVVVSKKASKP